VLSQLFHISTRPIPTDNAFSRGNSFGHQLLLFWQALIAPFAPRVHLAAGEPGIQDARYVHYGSKADVMEVRLISPLRANSGRGLICFLYRRRCPRAIDRPRSYWGAAFGGGGSSTR
jgi:hypothetical protein